MMLKRRTALSALIACMMVLILSACTTSAKTSSTAKDIHNDTVYDHSELTWYIQQRYGVEESACEFYSYDAGDQAYLLARFSGGNSGPHYVLRAFGDGVANWYQQGSWILDSVGTSTFEQTSDGKTIELVEFVYGNTLIHMFVTNNKEGRLDRLFVLIGSDDYYGKEGEFFIWDYDRSGRVKGQFHGSGLFNEAFYGLDARGEFIKDYGDFNTYTYDGNGRLSRVIFTTAKFSNNVLSEIEGSAGIGVGAIEFSYDANGNRSAAMQDISGRHEEVKFSRDASGRIVQVTVSVSDLTGTGIEPYNAKVTVNYQQDGSSTYSEPIVE